MTAAFTVATSNVKIFDLDSETVMREISDKGVTLASDGSESIQFHKKGNPTTGYTWNVDEAATQGAFTVSTQYLSDNQRF